VEYLIAINVQLMQCVFKEFINSKSYAVCKFKWATPLLIDKQINL